MVRLRKPTESRSLWADALFRLRRNRAAILGAIILLLTVITAVFAPAFAPRKFDAAVLSDNNAAPEWITRVFPTMISRDQGGYVTVKNDYFLGADKLGRDLLSRIIYGAQISLGCRFHRPFDQRDCRCPRRLDRGLPRRRGR